jgi:hypothetical protein
VFLPISSSALWVHGPSMCVALHFFQPGLNILKDRRPILASAFTFQKLTC